MKTLDISNFKVLQTKAETEVLWKDLTKPVRKAKVSAEVKAQLKYEGLVRKACKQMVARDKRINRIARQIAHTNLYLSKHCAHVTAMWQHLVATKGQDYVDLIVALRKAKRQPYFTLQK